MFALYSLAQVFLIHDPDLAEWWSRDQAPLKLSAVMNSLIGLSEQKKHFGSLHFV